MSKVINPKVLAEHQERLLEKFFDNECGFVEGLKARRLICRCDQAKRYLIQLQSLRDVAETSAKHADDSGLAQVLGWKDAEQVDLWQRINQRLDQESRAAVLLGERVIRQPGIMTRVKEEGLSVVAWEYLREYATPTFGVSSAVAGVLMFVIMSSMWEGPANPDVRVAGTAAPAIALSSQAQVPVTMASTNAVDPLYRAANKIDWARGRGKVQFINPQRSSNSILWVRRPAPKTYYSSQAAAAQASPLMRVSKTEYPQVMRERIPQSLSIANGR